MRRVLLATVLMTLVSGLFGCGPDKPAVKEPQFSFEPEKPHHDYTLTWIYAIGEVDAPGAAECKKAAALAEAESDCVGAACKYGRDLVADYQFACRKIDRAAERNRIEALGDQFKSRSTQAATDCVREVDDWLNHGCGAGGACESGIQRWATRCSEETKTPLALQVLQRVLENSSGEGRRVKLDARGCSEYVKKIELAGKCNKFFDCVEAQPITGLYLERCSQGERKAVSLMDALRIDHIRLGAEKEVTSIPLTEGKSKLATLPGMLALANGNGAIIKVCGEAVTDLSNYMKQRESCKNGELEVLLAVKAPDGFNLELQKQAHESDATFIKANPNLLVMGEADARGQQAVEQFVAVLGALPEKAAQDFTSAFEQANDAYAAVPANLRQSPKLYKALAAHDAVLADMFGLIGEQKIAIVTKRTSNKELLSFAQRANKFVFSDLNRQGSIGLGKNSELGELAVEAALPKAFVAYRRGLAKLNTLLAQRRLKLPEGSDKAQISGDADESNSAVGVR